MSDEEQRVAIAEACGFKIVRERYSPGGALDFWALIAPGGNCVSSGAKARPDEPDVFTVTDYVSKFSLGGVIPDYLSDLNAMHEAEKGLPSLPYLYRLGEVVCGDYNAMATMGKLAELIKATARQRAEAFLRTIGKWKDS